MDKVATIAIREFIETVRTKAFFIGAILIPGLTLGFVYGSAWIGELAEQEAMPVQRIGLIDETGVLAGELRAQLEAYNQENPNRRFELTQPQPPADVESLAAQVRTGELYAYLRIPAEVIDGQAACELGRQDQRLQAARTLRDKVNAAVRAVRFREADPPIDLAQVEQLQRRVEVEAIDVRSGAGTQGSPIANLIAPFVVMFLLFMGTMQISYGLLTSVLEEKSSRVIEVLLSAVSPLQLMAGKILGMVLVGATLLSVWGGVGYWAASVAGAGNLVSGRLLAYAVLYFVPGFLLLSSLLGAIGSACNTLKEAQSMASPITLLSIVPMVLWFYLSQNPGSTLSVVLSYIPPITPFVMILRVAADPHTPLWQVLSTLAVLWASVLLTIWAAGKIFRVGVLMYGKPPTPRELLRWVRYA